MKLEPTSRLDQDVLILNQPSQGQSKRQIGIARLANLAAAGILFCVATLFMPNDRSASLDLGSNVAVAQETGADTDALKESMPGSSVTGDDSLEQDRLTEAEQKQIEEIIRSFLRANPEIVRDAIQALQQKENEAAIQAQVQTIEDNQTALFRSESSAVLGNPNGDVTLVEFFDYNCGYCRRANPDMKALLANDPSLRIVLKEFPILGDGSVQAARVSIAVLAAAPDKFLRFHNALMSEPGEADGARAISIAEELGFDVDELAALMEGEAVTATIAEASDLALKLNLTGTPSYVTAQEVIIGAVGYEGLRAAIEKARESCVPAESVC